MNTPFSLIGKTILVTGASSGIGRAIAIRCSEMGAAMVITARNQERLSETMQLLTGDGHKMVIADLTILDDLNQLIDQLPVLQGVVHNAGVGTRVTTKDVSYNDIEQIMQPNFVSPIMLQARLLSAKKIQKKASLVFIASRAANAPAVGNALYSASKGAIISYSKVLALELAPRQIRVNCICPAMVMTDLISVVGFTDQELAEAQQKYPLRRYGKPDDIAYLAIYLLSDASEWMTGSCIDITGGENGL